MMKETKIVHDAPKRRNVAVVELWSGKFRHKVIPNKKRKASKEACRKFS